MLQDSWSSGAGLKTVALQYIKCELVLKYIFKYCKLLRTYASSIENISS